MNSAAHDRPRDTFDVELPAELASSLAARRLLGRACRQWSIGDPVRADAALAVSELVTNSVLHARTGVRVCIRRLGPGLRIEVEDGDPRLPIVEATRAEDLLENRSMTGRGLALVAATCDRWGADPLTEGGKSTWVEVGTGRRLVPEAASPSFPPAPAAPVLSPPQMASGMVARQAVSGGGRRVHLVGVPVSLILESTRQLSDLQRELQVMALGGWAPPDVDQVIQAGRPWIGDIDLWADSDRRMAERAAARGVDVIDFDVIVPDDISTRIEGVTAWLRRAAANISRRRLLTLPASREVAAYRRWYGEEILRQVGGALPRRCPLGVPPGS